MRALKNGVLLFFCFICNYNAYAMLKIGTVFFYPPFIISVRQGFDIDLANTLCQRIQEPCTFVAMDFEQLFKALNANEIDLAIGGITISRDLAKHYIFSLPYILSKGSFLILASNNTRLQNIDNLNGKKIGVIKEYKGEGVFYNYLLITYGDRFKIVQYDDIEDILSDLGTGALDAAFTHESSALYWEQNSGGRFKILGPPSPVGNGIGIIATPANLSLIQKINQQLKSIEQDGTYLKLYNTYFANER